MDTPKYAIIVAAGSGIRMGSPLPKQFLEINGKAIVHHTMEKFYAYDRSIKVLLVLNKDYFKWWKDYCYSHSFYERHTLVEGGITRFHSVKNALEKVPDGALVAIQDAVRPMVSVELIDDMFLRASKSDSPALIPAYPCVDTLVSLSLDMKICGPAPDRSMTFTVQTPQIFHSTELKQAYMQPFDRMFTDDASVLRSALGDAAIDYCLGDKYNFKITTKEDLALAEKLL